MTRADPSADLGALGDFGVPDLDAADLGVSALAAPAGAGNDSACCEPRWTFALSSSVYAASRTI